ncbi:SDR family NAD(P)-dependent oxidoreductase [Thalassotalea sediminis]|uniref:SDR family NAD(P)-dependent oxidoreductase n=1 Tax=Thalassotalea sediminis TaxID=1759089 RepID=UPI0025734B30|nr:SDR family NAD(P)-dependent oxidoreductase [Thalassotalea sediminis]
MTKNIIITGGANGLGRHMVEYLLEKGSNVISLDINASQLSDLEKSHENLASIQCDITNTNSLLSAFEQIKEKFHYADVLINNAGIIHNEPLFNFFNKGERTHNISAWKRVIDINLTASFETASYFVEQLALKRKKGVIVNISSVSSTGTAGQSAYAASKAGLNALTKTWAKELGSLGIRTVSISPGYIDSEAMHQAVPKEIQKDILSKTALRKLGSKESIMQAVELAIYNEFMTGTVIEVDGGLLK